MSILQTYLNGVGDAIVRAALYYVCRYVKQAGYFDEYGKDIFEDEERSAPGEEVKDLALRMIAAIEEREGIRASELTGKRMIEILDEITAIEDELGPEPTDDQLARAEQFVSTIRTPSSRT